MRLYRGLKRRYRPELVSTDRLSGTDFTDCALTALQYASTRNGVVLVIDVPDDEIERSLRVTEELWLVEGPKRLMVWGAFDTYITLVIEAKELRAALRREGGRRLPDASKSQLLRLIIGDEIEQRDGYQVAGRG